MSPEPGGEIRWWSLIFSLLPIKTLSNLAKEMESSWFSCHLMRRGLLSLFTSSAWWQNEKNENDDNDDDDDDNDDKEQAAPS